MDALVALVRSHGAETLAEWARGVDALMQMGEEWNGAEWTTSRSLGRPGHDPVRLAILWRLMVVQRQAAGRKVSRLGIAEDAATALAMGDPTVRWALGVRPGSPGPTVEAVRSLFRGPDFPV